MTATIQKGEEISSTSSLTSQDSLINRKLYKRRWVVLFLYCVSLMFLNPHIGMYTIISHISKDYYNASVQEVNMTSNILQIILVIFYLPGVWFVNKTNLRIASLVSLFLSTSGAWIKVIGVDPSLLWLVICGQGLISIGYSCFYNILTRLATVWFSKNEVSTACSLMCFCVMAGFEIGFLVIPRIVTENSDIEITKSQFYSVTIGLAGINTILFILLLIYFPASPPTPPNNAVIDQVLTTKEFSMSLKNLLTNKRFVFYLLGTFSIIAATDVFSSIIDEIIQDNFKGEEFMASTIAGIYMGIGMACIPLYGILLDRTKKFREILWTLLAITCACLVSFSFVFQAKSKVAVYIVSAFFGASAVGISPVWYENIVELTYPEREFTACGLCNVTSSFGSFVMNLVFTNLLTNFGSFWANIFVGSSSIVGVLCMSQIGRRLKRQEAFNS